jgi:hypothetical protein
MPLPQPWAWGGNGKNLGVAHLLDHRETMLDHG